MMGCFYDLKLYLMINDQGGIISVKVTNANMDDKSLCRKWLKRFDGVYTKIKVISLTH
ncbi:Mobile element protein [Candidatus Enterovibrio escicola]|uniref:Mobile element protein n=2 Tax=Candidatus Enterovibrio escicola TaxID=1927127 RepID=A0A2A5T2R1_9GAMM|nr:Mobile element protein [Candidatus Enterovibrio escacola]